MNTEIKRLKARRAVLQAILAELDAMPQNSPPQPEPQQEEQESESDNENS